MKRGFYITDIKELNAYTSELESLGIDYSETWQTPNYCIVLAMHTIVQEMHSIEYKGELEDIKFKRVHSNLQSLRLGGDHIGFVSGDSKRGWNAVPAYKQQVPSKFGQARGFKTRLDAAFWIVKVTGIEEMY